MTEEQSKAERESEKPSERTSAPDHAGTGRAIRVVAIDDEPSMLEFYQAAAAGLEAVIECTTEPSQGLAMIREIDPDLLILDQKMPGMDGFEVLDEFVRAGRRGRVVMITGNYSIEMAVKAIQQGASDYVCKPITVEKARELIEGARAEVDREERVEAVEKELIEVFNLGGLIGRGPAMTAVFDLIQRVAPHFRTALITGETGTGKELAARALHRLGPRAQSRLSIFNCGAIVDALAESQLFGHRKGAFTGAISDQEGIFEWANGGTVFLDEIGELSAAAQSKLLRILETGEMQKLGSPQTSRVDVSVIAATSRDLHQEMKEGRFRPDLWYRLNMVHIQLPPLRERKEDILLLARYFLERFKAQYGKEVRGLSRSAQAALLAYLWPGNVRDLENAIGRATMLARGKFIERDDLPENVRNLGGTAPGTVSSLEEAEKAALIRALEEAQNKAGAARMLGISRATLYRLMEKHGVDPNAS